MENNNINKSKLAVTSFVLGILSLLFLVFTGIPAMILGIIALVKISQAKGQLRGIGYAIIGIVIPVIWPPLVMIMAILLPAFSAVDATAKITMQKAQFHSVDVALDLFKNENGYYPPSEALGKDGEFYCGTMKLTEALFGQDLLGFHPESEFQLNGKNKKGEELYFPNNIENIKRRTGPYLEVENVYKLKDIFRILPPGIEEKYVLCDQYKKQRHSGIKTGMPILYFKANPKTDTMGGEIPVAQRIYNINDNIDIILLADKSTSGDQPNPDEFFYSDEYKIVNKTVTDRKVPYRPNSYILISAGSDGIYGTKDDIVNFEEWHK